MTCCPRVWSMDYLNDKEKDEVYHQLKKECIRLAESKPTVVKVEKSSSPSPKKRNVDQYDLDDDLAGVIITKMERPKSVNDQVELELVKYRDEPSLGMKFQHHLEWWKVHSYKYSHLSKVMEMFLHLPASSVPSKRVFSTAGGVFNKREHLAPDNADLLIFQYHNIIIGNIEQVYFHNGNTYETIKGCWNFMPILTLVIRSYEC